MRGTVGDILATLGGGAWITRYLDACVAVATQKGYPPQEPVMQRISAMLSTLRSTLSASMPRDLENGDPIEADHIVDFMQERARAHGVDAGMLAVVYAHAKVYVRRWGQKLQVTAVW